MARRVLLLCASFALCPTAASAELEQRFEVADVTWMEHFPVAYDEVVQGQPAASGSFSNSVLEALLHVPQRPGERDAFIWELEYRRHMTHFTQTSPLVSAHGEHSSQQQLLRLRWTWRHEFDSGYNLLVHNRTGIYGEHLKADVDWLRVGMAAGAERRFGPKHSLGLGLLVMVGIGPPSPIPFLRYQWSSARVSIDALLPPHAHVYWSAADWLEVGAAFAMDGTSYRVDRDVPYDRIERIYSSFGPSVRARVLGDVFLRADVGVTVFRRFSLHREEDLVSDVDLGTSPALLLRASYEPAY